MSDILAEQCEKVASAGDSSAGPVRALEIEIHDTVFGRDTYNCGGDGQRGIPKYARSLDAAMALLPEGWHVTHSGEGRFLTRGRFVATVETWGVEQAEDGSDIHTTPNRRHGVAETFALAICSAALRARAGVNT